ncbi:MAG: flagellar assembly protein FliH [Rhodocyclaceae bacterium]
MASSDPSAVFTPREKLSAYRKWEAASFTAEAPASARGKPEAAAPGRAPGAGIRLPTADEIEAIRAQAHKQGYEAGYEEGTARARMEALRIHTLVENLERALCELDRQVADELLALAVELARQVVRQSVGLRPDAILSVVHEALAQLPHQQAVIYLNPQDAALVRAHLGETLAHAGHRVFEDEALTRGGCRVESAGSQIDATLETRWRRVLESIGHGQPWLEAEAPPGEGDDTGR